jgi:hypothetical protein
MRGASRKVFGFRFGFLGSLLLLVTEWLWPKKQEARGSHPRSLEILERAQLGIYALHHTHLLLSRIWLRPGLLPWLLATTPLPIYKL